MPNLAISKLGRTIAHFFYLETLSSQISKPRIKRVCSFIVLVLALLPVANLLEEPK